MPIVTEYRVEMGTACYRLQGSSSIVEAVEFVAGCVSACRGARIGKLMVNGIAVRDVPVPTLVDRFLAVEEWAELAEGMVIIALVIEGRYITPDRFGVKVAADFGLTLDVYTDEREALAWLEEGRETPPIARSHGTPAEARGSGKA